MYTTVPFINDVRCTRYSSECERAYHIRTSIPVYGMATYMLCLSSTYNVRSTNVGHCCHI